MGGPWLDHEKGKLTAFHHSVLEGQASTLCFPWAFKSHQHLQEYPARFTQVSKMRNQEIVRWLRFKVETVRIFILPEFIYSPVPKWAAWSHSWVPLYPLLPLPSCLSQNDSFCKAQPRCHLLQAALLKQCSQFLPLSKPLITFSPSPPYFAREGNMSYLPPLLQYFLGT